MFGPALVQLAGRVQVARPVAVGDDEPVASRARSASARAGSSFAARARRTPGCRRSRARSPGRAARRPSPRARASARRRREHLVRPVLRRLHVGLVERVDLEDRAGDRDANSQRKNSCAELVRVGEADLLRLAVGAVGRLARRRHEALALLAGRLGDSCSAQRPKPPASRRCRPCRGRRASRRRTGGRARARVAVVEAAGLGHLAARARSRRATSTPISAAGTIPNGESAE